MKLYHQMAKWPNFISDRVTDDAGNEMEGLVGVNVEVVQRHMGMDALGRSGRPLIVGHEVTLTFRPHHFEQFVVQENGPHPLDADKWDDPVV